MLRVALAAFLACAACGADSEQPRSQAPATGAYQSGSRLRARLYIHDASGNCIDPGYNGISAVWALDREVPMSTFVRADRVTESRGTSFDLDLFVAEDGAREIGRVFDHARGVPCTTPAAID